MRTENLDGIAIIGMAGRFPGAGDISQFWENLRNGVESITRFRPDELAEGTPREGKDFVPARAIVSGADCFDAGFFGYHPRDAELIDPQQRLFLEACWHAFEDAGYDPLTFSGKAGVFAGASFNTYFLSQQCSQPGFAETYAAGYQVDGYPVLLGTNPDFVATRVSYKLNLRGPAFTIAAGCSTSMLAVWQACQNLLSYHCDLALAGGASVTFPQQRGYRYQEGGMVSPDGHCRPFDVNAQGTVFGDGVGVVLLKRVAEAVADGDSIYAVIKGSGVNNDGARKVGFTAPGVDGQSQAISLALADAGVDARSISYVEAHGTATPLGDPIEVAALTKAYRKETSDKSFCALGTAKAHVGHLDVAAGVTGVIKAALSLHHRELPGLLHFTEPNEKLNLSESPFFATSETRSWERESDLPLRAGVSAFGVGGTNVHLILEEPPPRAAETPAREVEVLPLSAKTLEALERARLRLASAIEADPSISLASIAHTLQTGRRDFEYRRAVVCANRTAAIAGLREPDGNRSVCGRATEQKRGTAFLFPGQGSQYAGMGAELYRTEPAFRNQFDQCAEILDPILGLNLKSVLYPAAGVRSESQRLLDLTAIAQPALFAVEYSLLALLRECGVEPVALLGHSVGEITAACAAQVFSLEDALHLVAERGRLMQQMPAGGMIAVSMRAEDAASLADHELVLAAVNSRKLSVLSGPAHRVTRLEAELRQKRLAAKRLNTNCAAHSPMMDPAAAELISVLRTIRFQEPQLPMLSSMTGTWITPGQITRPEYWIRQMRERVQFQSAIGALLANGSRALVEVGPGEALTTFARQEAGTGSDHQFISPLSTGRGMRDQQDGGELAAVHRAMAALWTTGEFSNWSKLTRRAKGSRISLPGYSFERKRVWLERESKQISTAASGPPAAQAAAIQEEAVPMQANDSVMDREPRLTKVLTELFEELSGTPASELDPSRSFLELGFDSLFLTQVSQSVQERFGQRISFRQLVDEESSIAALARYLMARVPTAGLPEAIPAAALQVAAAPVTTSAPIASTQLPPASLHGFELVMKQQLDAMSNLVAQQLQFLGGSASVTAPSPAPVAAPEPQKQAGATAATTSAAPEFTAFGPYKPVQKGPGGQLLAQQQQHLKNLIDRYTTKTAGSKRMAQQYRHRHADPRVVSGFRSQWKEMVYPLVTERSKGSKLWDVDGNEYVDILNGFGPTMFGHAPDFVQQAVHAQVDAGFEIGPQSPLAGRVAEMICEMTGNERATFCNTGSEAVMAALRVARTVTGRKRIVLFAGSYHGAFDEVLVKQIKRGGELRSGPVAPGIPKEKTDNVTVLDYGTDASLEWIRAHAGELAAVLVEPVQSRHPALQPIAFLQEIRRITAASGAALIFDEVVTGFRTHPGGLQAMFEIRADMATYGKVLAGGLPMGVLAGSSKFLDALDGGAWQYGDASVPEVGVTFFAGTFVRHPLAIAAAHAVLLHLQQQGPGLQQALTARTAAMVAEINALFAARQAPVRIEQFASIFYFSFPTDQPFGSLFYYHLREQGVHLLEGFPCFLTTEHSDADVRRIVAAFTHALITMQTDGMLSGGVDVPTQALLPAEAPLTEEQLEILLSDQMGVEASCAFNESFSLRLQGKLDVPALSAALTRVFHRHEALRTHFDLPAHRQLFAADWTLDLPHIDLRAYPEQEQQTRLAALVAADAAQPFHLAQGPLVRVSLLQLADNDHVLRFTSHHAVCDGWSTNVILSELSEIYSAITQGRTAQLPTPLPFSSYAASQIEFGKSAAHLETETYWLSQFKDTPPVLELPTDRPRTGEKSYHGATRRGLLARPAYLEFRKAAAAQGCTLFSGLLGAFQLLLARLSGLDDIVVGIPAAGQSLAGQSPLVGHCVNFLPLRAHIDPSAIPRDFLKSVKRSLLDAYEHQNYTFGTLVRKLNLPRDPARLPLVEVQFNLEKIGSGLQFGDLAATVDPSPKSFVNFDLFLNVIETNDGLIFDCDYNTALFDQATIDRWLTYYTALLESLAQGLTSDSSRPLGELSFLPSAERELLLKTGNETTFAIPNRCVHDLIDEQAEKTPDKTAVVFETLSLTYRELARRSSCLAAALLELGIGSGKTVALCLDRSLDVPVAMLAVLKTGAAYVPLDPAHPRERLLAILEDVLPAAILSHSSYAAHQPAFAPSINLDHFDWFSTRRPVPLPPQVLPGTLAYIIYTSGSTGKPKGVEISHRALVNLLCTMKQRPGFSPADTLLAVTTFAFDISGLELLLPLLSGGKLIVANRDTCVDGMRLLALIRTAGVTVMQATPATWGLLLEAGFEDGSGLKILCGGEALPRDLANRLIHTGAELWNMYGPTETTIWSSTCRVTPGEDAVSIGSPVGNTRFYVLDRQRQLLPSGVPGELYIAGTGVAEGYRNRPDLTAKAFFPDPFFGGQMYKTGDLVRRPAGGELEFLGRLDNQIKLRGFRIELGEIEAAIERHQAVDRAAVVLRADRSDEKQLVAFLTAKTTEPIATSALRTYLESQLPRYMIPNAFVRLEKMPQSAAGKIDRRSLPDLVESKSAANHLPPATPTEQRLAEIWCEVLGLEQVSVDESLFRLGADSLQIFRIAARAKRASLEVTAAMLMKLRTIGAVAAELEKNLAKTPATPRIQAVARQNYRVSGMPV